MYLYVYAPGTVYKMSDGLPQVSLPSVNRIWLVIATYSMYNRALIGAYWIGSWLWVFNSHLDLFVFVALFYATM